MSGVWSGADIRKKNSRTIWTVAQIKIFGGIYLAKVISSVFWNADICSYGCEDRLLQLHVAVQMHCFLTEACHLECRMRVRKQGYRSPALPGKAKLLKVPGHPLCKLAEGSRVHPSLVSWTTSLKSQNVSLQVLPASLSALQTSSQSICCNGNILCLWPPLNTAKVLLPLSPSLL